MRGGWAILTDQDRKPIKIICRPELLERARRILASEGIK